ncbi:MAG: site-2 protease family protein, partial [Planctomycetota bacterium]
MTLTPDVDEELGLTTIGISGPPIDPTHKVVVIEEGPAYAAGVRSGDRLIDVKSGPGAALPEMPLSERLAGSFGSSEALVLELEREADGTNYTVEVQPAEPDPKARKLMGVANTTRTLAAVRKNERTRDLDLQVGDELLSVSGRPVLNSLTLRLAFVEALEKGPVSILLERTEGEEEMAVSRQVTVNLPAEFDRSDLVALASDLALERDLSSTELYVTPGSAADLAGVRSGDRMMTMDGDPVRNFEDITTKSRAAAKSGDPIVVEVERDSATGGDPEVFKTEIELAATTGGFGFGLSRATYVYQSESPLEAIRVGTISSWRFLQDTWRTLKGMVLGDVAAKNIGGIITIAVVADDFAKTGLSKLFFFLCLLSVNL